MGNEYIKIFNVIYRVIYVHNVFKLRIVHANLWMKVVYPLLLDFYMFLWLKQQQKQIKQDKKVTE